tara:strand:+ start:1016 stop:4204 length:3189 start_codon:yes stop_codon:yes gene_type:complete
MAAVNQSIPNFLGGVSQQPDKIKFPGQLRVCDNAVPDVTFGLKKRPSGEFVKTLTNANSTGYWYEIIRDGDEKYLFQITPANTGSGQKPIRIWDLSNGNELSLTNSNGDALFAYLSGATEEYAIQTIQDYTIIVNKQKTIGTTGNTFSPIHSGDYSYARLDTVAYNTEYILYSGTAPTPNTYYRATSVKVDVIEVISEFTVTNQGSGYSTSSPPTVTLSGGGGTGATAKAIVEDGKVTRVEVTDAGSGYTSAPTVTFSGSGGAAATAVVGSGPTWISGNENQAKSGTLTWSFSGGSSVTTTGAQVGGTNITENIEGSLQVNGQSFIANNVENFDGGDFLGYTQNYDVRYTATVTLRDSGLIKTTNKTTAENVYVDVTLEGIKYRLSVEAVEPVETYKGISGIGYYKSPRNPDNGTLSMATILNGLKASVNSSLANVTAEVIGSGLFMYGSAASSVNFLGGAVNENMSVIGQKAQDISKLPAMCKHGYVAQISNTADLETDDYYVKFEADNGTSGAGSWEECVRPHNFAGTAAIDAMVLGLDPATMPHALVNNRNGTFSFIKLDEATATARGNENYWDNRTVGDNTSNPFPTFEGNNIQEIFFHRNRLGLISGENIILSQPGNYFNFFVVSAISASDDNPIDITVSDIKPAFINHTLPIQKGLLMFSDNGQFLLFTESDIFSSKTARLKKVSSFECDSSIQPVDMGTSVLFTSNVSSHARAFEATILDDDTPPAVLEQTRVVPEFLPKTITKSCNSVPIGIVTYGQKGEQEVYHYKYYNTGQKREQSAWYTWTLTGTMQHMLYTGGSFFTVTAQGSNFILSRYEYVTDASSNRAYVVGGVPANIGSPLKTARWFEPCLDNLVEPTTITGTAQTTTAPEKTVVAIPYTPTGASEFYMVGISGNDSAGNSIAGVVRKADAVGTGTATFNGINIASNAKIVLGYRYTTIVELPTYYYNKGQTNYDLDGELRIAGLNFELGVSGPMEFHQNPIYANMSSYVQYESGMLTNASNYNQPPSELSKSVRVPVQKKNDRYTMQIQIPDPFSIALLSASWDGNYSNKRHVRR